MTMTDKRKKLLHEEYMANQRLIEKCTKELSDPRCSQDKIRLLSLVKLDMENDNQDIIEILATDRALNNLTA
jgi:hypothetical protein